MIMDIRKLPLWKNALEEMLSSGIEYGKSYTAEWFEARLMCKRDTMQYGLEMAKIREALEHEGYAMSGRGQKGDAQIILEAASNSAVMQSYQVQAAKALKRAVILGANTDTSQLKPSELAKHEKILERAAIKSALLGRSGKVARVVRHHAPECLK